MFQVSRPQWLGFESIPGSRDGRSPARKRAWWIGALAALGLGSLGLAGTAQAQPSPDKPPVAVDAAPPAAGAKTEPPAAPAAAADAKGTPKDAKATHKAHGKHVAKAKSKAEGKHPTTKATHKTHGKHTAKNQGKGDVKPAAHTRPVGAATTEPVEPAKVDTTAKATTKHHSKPKATAHASKPKHEGKPKAAPEGGAKTEPAVFVEPE